MGAAGTAYIHGTDGAGDDVCSITRVNTNSWYNLYWNGAANIAGRLTVGDQIYLNAGWFRSQQSGTGWYSEAHGGGIWMQDSTWVRTYGGKGFLIAGGGSGGDLRLESYSPTITCYDSDNGTTHWLHCNDNNHGFLASNAFSWCAYRDGSNNWVATGNIVAYASDARLKKNIVDASASKVADFFDRFRVREFDWDAKAIAELNPTFHPSADHEVGGIAQEAEEVYSLMVATHANGIKTIQWEKAIPSLSLRCRRCVSASRTLGEVPDGPPRLRPYLLGNDPRRVWRRLPDLRGPVLPRTWIGARRSGQLRRPHERPDLRLAVLQRGQGDVPSIAVAELPDG
jgi:hypothetical protein